MIHYNTWQEVKLATLQKMFASKGQTIQIDSSNEEYIYAMPQACNEALQLLSTAGKFIIEPVQIVVSPLPNLIMDSTAKKTYSIIGDKVVFNAKGAKSFYFRANGNMEVHIYVDGEEYTATATGEDDGSIDIPILIDTKSFDAFKGLIENPDNKDVRIEFISDYPSNIKNIALYEASFPLPKDVQPFEDFIHFHLPDIAEDFYQLASGEIYYEGEREPRYIAAQNYYQEADKTLVLERSMPGTYTVYYKKYPAAITNETEDEYELVLDPEVAALLPMYMASQLYKDDDNAIATVYRNEFEVAFERLTQYAEVPKKEEFVSDSGWC